MINNSVLVGRLTKDPELKYTPSGVAVVAFTIAVNRTFSNEQGEKEADFINCVAWRKQAENLANFQKKGSLLGVQGRIQTRNYEGQDGKKVYVTEVVADSIQFLDPVNKNNNGQQGNNGGYNPNQQQQGNNGGYNPNQQQQGNNGGYNPNQQQQQGNTGGYNPNQQQQQGNTGGYNPNQQQQQGNNGGYNPNQQQQQGNAGYNPNQQQQQGGGNPFPQNDPFANSTSGSGPIEVSEDDLPF